MIDAFISAAIVATLNLHTFIPPAQVTDQALRVRSFEQAAETFGRPPAAIRVSQAPSPRRDSLKNGAIIGAIAGAAAGAFLAAIGCGLGDLWGGEDTSSCAGGTMILVGMGAGFGALIGVGVDALFERVPFSGQPAGGRRVGVRIRVAF